MSLAYQNIPGTTLLATGYTIPVLAANVSPVDGLTYYFGMMPKAPSNTADTAKCNVRQAGTIRIANIYTFATTAGTNENISLYIRKNNTTDTLIQTVGLATSERIFFNAALVIPMAAGDYFEIKMICPTWVINPLTMFFGGYVYLE